MFCLIFLFVSCYKVEPTTLEVTVKEMGMLFRTLLLVLKENQRFLHLLRLKQYMNLKQIKWVVQFYLGNIIKGQSGVAILKVIANDKIGSEQLFS